MGRRDISEDNKHKNKRQEMIRKKGKNDTNRERSEKINKKEKKREKKGKEGKGVLI